MNLHAGPRPIKSINILIFAVALTVTCLWPLQNCTCFGHNFHLANYSSLEWWLDGRRSFWTCWGVGGNIVDTEVFPPRRCGRQTLRANILGDCHCDWGPEHHCERSEGPLWGWPADYLQDVSAKFGQDAHGSYPRKPGGDCTAF